MKTPRSKRLRIAFLCHTVIYSSAPFHTDAFIISNRPRQLMSKHKSSCPNSHALRIEEDHRDKSILYAKPKRKKRASEDLNGQSKSFNADSFKQGTMDTALCIIPPDGAWDDIQRARHFARDPSFYYWPPAIRLFHPFVDRLSITEVASSIAELIEKYDLESFEITVDKLLIVPHFEHLQAHEESRRHLPDQARSVEEGPSEDEERVQALIRSEELKGKRKLEKRRSKEKALKRQKEYARKQQVKEMEKDIIDSEMGDEIQSSQPKNGETPVTLGPPSANATHARSGGYTKDQSPKEILKDQRKSMSQFNGPCVLCLEPNEESKIHIQAFREILRKKLFSNYDPFSVSSIVTRPKNLKNGLPKQILKQHGLLNSASEATKSKLYRKKRVGSSFKPNIALGRFSTVTKAVEIANKLQQVWEPLTFRVCDLQLVSKLGSSSASSSVQSMEEEEEDGSDDEEQDGGGMYSDPYSIKVDKNGTPSLYENRELTLRKFHGSDGTGSILSTKGEYGCDGKSHQSHINMFVPRISILTCTIVNTTLAMIMLQGEEGQLLKKPKPLETDGLDDDLMGEDEEEASSLFMEQEDEDRIMELLLSPAAIPGGQGNRNGDGLSNGKWGQGEGSEDKVQSWLEEDEDLDDGATIIIGRTQFFMGEMRQYTGMPAASTMDGKDRVMEDSGVSGSARRRGAVHRQGDRWQEGDYGRKEKDYLP